MLPLLTIARFFLSTALFTHGPVVLLGRVGLDDPPDNRERGQPSHNGFAGCAGGQQGQRNENDQGSFHGDHLLSGAGYMKTDDVIKYHAGRHKALLSGRALWDQRWQECVDYVMPWKEHVTGASPQGAKRTTKIYDGTPSYSLNVLSAGLLGHNTSEMAPWYQYQIVNDMLANDPDVREWLQEVTRIDIQSLGKTNFYQILLEFYEDLVGFCTAHLFQVEDPEAIRRFHVFPPREVTIAENHKGEVDTHYRQYEQTLRELAQEFGVQSLSNEAREALNTHPDNRVTVVHGTFPKETWVPDRMDAEGKPWASIYWEKATEHPLHEGGYWEDPWHTARWRKTSREVYGRGPTIDTMPDIKTLHKQRRSDLLAGQKIVEPPLWVPASFAGRLRTSPNAVNHYRRDRGGEKPEALGDILGNVPFGMEMTNDTRALVKQAFFVDVFLMLSQETAGMTATEVVERVQERLMILGPAIGRLHSEALGPAIERGFNIMSRAGMFPDPPEVLRGETLTVDYISPLAKALKALEGRATQNAMGFASPFLQLDPDAAIVFDAKKAIRRGWDLYGAPTEALRSEEEVQLIEEERAKVAQLQQMLQLMQQGAEVDRTGEEAESARAARR